MPSTESQPLLLLIDDSIAEQRLLIELLRSHQFRLAIAVNGTDGYRKALLNMPDLILLDVSMPGINGFEVCRMLKANPLTMHIPIIFLTSMNTPDERVNGLHLGAVDYIPKPFSTRQEVLARIQLHLPVAPSADADRGNFSPAGVAQPHSALVRLAVEYLTRDLVNAPPPAELAQLVGTNETSLNRAFRRELTMPICAYLRECRLARARHLLSTTDLSIHLIGEQIGYQHSGNFTTAFRLRYGQSPRDFRQTVNLQREDNFIDTAPNRRLLHP